MSSSTFNLVQFAPRFRSAKRWACVTVFAACCLLHALTVNAATLQITQLDDINFGSVPANATRLRQNMVFCVSMTPGGPYQITAFGTQANQRFALLDIDGVATPIGLDVRFSRNRGRGGRLGQGGRRMLPGIPIRNVRARTPLADGSCRRESQVQIQVRVNEQDLAAAQIGRYQGQLQITVAPE